jgi:RimJ/RimL family protein N-acetyltransferase
VGSAAERYFAIHLKGGRAIGYAALRSIDQRRASAEAVVVIGEPGEWHKGYGRETARLLASYAFMVLNLHRVWARVPEHNSRAVSCLAAAGFEREGTLRDDHHHLGAYRSSHLMSVLREERPG